MKNILYICFLGMIFLSCQSQPEGTHETWWINSSKVDCVGVGPQSCFQISKAEEFDRQNWELFYSEIEGFEYEPGNIYHIKLEIIDKTGELPADASSKSYKLLEVLSVESDLSLRLTNIWKVIQVGELQNPVGSLDGNELTFEFNASEKTYFGQLGCNTIRGGIAENDGENLKLGLGATTMMACPDMETEQKISKALIETTRYQIQENELVFFDPEGTELIRFKAVD
ncbi:MAG: DUF4377 domain-containing protein [Algoriphagus sp.]|uniref:DUF4377 domain-containing protein n=1 Tax=Algoriphagus sp. TaxID=1872435 RepID=UPI0017C6072C|nr:DUF4377 domain-containing protein [Algoriphagus sp.]NVJ87685.1 DUF4377 domain-containing protein [Algoriphagus sp.]